MATLIRTIRGQPYNRIDGKTDGIRVIRGQIWPVANQEVASGGTIEYVSATLFDDSAVNSLTKVTRKISETVGATSSLLGSLTSNGTICVAAINESVSSVIAGVKKSFGVSAINEAASTVAGTVKKAFGIAGANASTGGTSGTAKVAQKIGALIASATTIAASVTKAANISSAIGAASSIASGLRKVLYVSGTNDSATSVLGSIKKSALASAVISSASAVASAVQKFTAFGVAIDEVSAVVSHVHRTMSIVGMSITDASWTAGWLHKAGDAMQAFYTFKDDVIKRAFAISRTLRFYDD